MKAFSALVSKIERTSENHVKSEILADFLRTSPKQDSLWAIALFSGKRPKRAATTAQLREWATEAANLPPWLFEDCQSVVGDIAETCALILPTPAQRSDNSLSHWAEELAEILRSPTEMRKAKIIAACEQLDAPERYLFNKLLTGGFRVDVSPSVITRALSETTGQDKATLALKLSEDWSPQTTTFHALIEANHAYAESGLPYPFCHSLLTDSQPTDLGSVENWQAEWKWHGVRAQYILRNTDHLVWSETEELMTASFPELSCLRDFLPSEIVMDGIIVAWDGFKPMPLGTLQKRLGRKAQTKKLLNEAPAAFVAFDLLERDGHDLRNLPLQKRRELLEETLRQAPQDAPVLCPDLLPLKQWDDLSPLRAKARSAGVEGVVLKRRNSPYSKKQGTDDWWHWKQEPMSIKAVLIYAEAANRTQSAQFTELTFAVWHEQELVPMGKAPSGLSKDDIREISTWVRGNTQQRFGPVRQVSPTLVFDITFDGLVVNTRRKSGLDTRAPKIRQWLKDTPISEANSLTDLQAMLAHK